MGTTTPEWANYRQAGWLAGWLAGWRGDTCHDSWAPGDYEKEEPGGQDREEMRRDGKLSHPSTSGRRCDGYLMAWLAAGRIQMMETEQHY